MSTWNIPNAIQLMVAVTASVLLIIGGFWWWSAAQSTIIPYQTARGKTQTVMLPDGTKLEVNGDTSLSVHLSSQERRIELEKGEIFPDRRP
jgi:transmembrane sensor